MAYRRDLQDLMFERVFTPLGITRDDLVWRTNAYRPEQIEGLPRREFGSGVHANVDAMARIGLLYLTQGKFQGKQILPSSFVKMARSVVPAFEDVPVLRSKDYPNASRHYGLLWWNNNDGSLKGVPNDAFWSWGLYDSLIVVIPSLDLVVARAGEGWGEHAIFSRLEPFLRQVSYNSGLKRYIMTQILPGEAPRLKGGFGVYDAPEPWGPWTTVFFTPLWDVGPGESSNFPTK